MDYGSAVLVNVWQIGWNDKFVFLTLIGKFASSIAGIAWQP